MSERKLGRWALLLAAAAVFAVSLILVVWVSTPSEQEPPSKAPLPTALPVQTLSQIEAKAESLTRERMANLPPVAIPSQVGGFPGEEVSAHLNRYREMMAVQGLYNQNVTRERLIGEILDSAHGADIASKTLSDSAFAREAFGDFQAEARVLSIDVMKEAARRGQDRYLERSTSAIAQDLARSDDGSGNLDKGRTADLRDLVRAYVDVKGLEAFTGSNPQAMQTLGYSATLPTGVKNVYDEVLFLRLKSQYGRERAAQMTAAILDH
ncbi:hypothetical protein [Hyalangium versicolor]|uniref:hypothetical protein n=1 Tax=Hyalangium versicolor TaxID=2861190 RepID=UPI001CCC2417|nr:hypothetical protein [Hyalangium versicolor]